MNPRQHQRLAGTAPPVQMAIFVPLVGAAVVNDLLHYPVPAMALRAPDAFERPLFDWLPVVTAGPTTTGIAIGAHAFALALAFMMVARVAQRAAALGLMLLYGYTLFTDVLLYATNVWLATTLLGLVALEPSDPGRRAPIYPRRAIQGLVVLIYLTAGLAKLTPEWLSGLVLRDALLQYGPVYSTFVRIDSAPLFVAFAWLTVAVELLLPFGLLFARTRRLAIAVGIAFHLGIEAMMPVRMFSWLMIASYVLFVPRDRLRPLLRHPWLRTPGRRVALAGAAALLHGVVFGWLRVYVFSLEAAVMLPFAAALAWIFARRASARPTRALLPRSARAPVLAAFLTLELALAARPWFGTDTRFSWRMFGESIAVRVELYLKVDDGWGRTPLIGVGGYWSTRHPKFYWDSWADQRGHLRAYARWAAEGSGRPVRVRALYVRNHAPPQVEVFSASPPLAQPQQ